MIIGFRLFILHQKGNSTMIKIETHIIIQINKLLIVEDSRGE